MNTAVRRASSSNSNESSTTSPTQQSAMHVDPSLAPNAKKWNSPSSTVSSESSTPRPSQQTRRHSYAKLGARRDVSTILIANNNLAALKAIRSLESWMYIRTLSTHSLRFVCMATPDDLAANAAYLSKAHVIEEVPAGPSANNFSNIDLIVMIAMKHKCTAVYPGWGHASEVPLLSAAVRAAGIAFLGPPSEQMFAVGDKMMSTILAQSLGIPVVPWSGMHLRVDACDLLNQATALDTTQKLLGEINVRDPNNCREHCESVGYPAVIKASEGGGGKGICIVHSAIEVEMGLRRVRDEVQSGRVFVMKYVNSPRHIEVQVMADEHGAVCVMGTRDCSMQRRHQKIVEEGPATSVSEALRTKMHNAAYQLMTAVKYVGLGTVEFLVDSEADAFYFLEVNPRIQVEHPVTELTTDVNLPAALLCIGMGISLHAIPELRRAYGKDADGSDLLPLTKTEQRDGAEVTVPNIPMQRGHTIAIRITSEDELFTPTTGRVDEITLPDAPGCWGYCSIPSGGTVHQYADSQIGHLFSTAATREEARVHAVLALRGVRVRGEIQGNTAYIAELLETSDFCAQRITTDWLDKRIRERAEVQRDVIPALVAASIMRKTRRLEINQQRYVGFLAAGHTPSTDLLQNTHSDVFVHGNTRYVVDGGSVAPNTMRLSIGDRAVTVSFRRLPDAAGIQFSLVDVSGVDKAYIAFGSEDHNEMHTRVSLAGRNYTFSGDYDPHQLRSQVHGRLVRFVVRDGASVAEGDSVAEVEVMKMILKLKAPSHGVIRFRVQPGTSLTVGQLVAEMHDPSGAPLQQNQLVVGSWPSHTTRGVITTQEAAPTRARIVIEELASLVRGYYLNQEDLEVRLKKVMKEIPTLSLSQVTRLSLGTAAETCNFRDQAPASRLQSVIEFVITEFYDTEKWFDVGTRAQCLEKLKDHYGDALESVYDVEFAHCKSARKQVLKAMLSLVQTDSGRMLPSLLRPVLGKLGSLTAQQNADIILQARYMLRRIAQPSRAEKCRQIALLLEGEGEEGMLKALEQSIALDTACELLRGSDSDMRKPLFLELFVRRAYHSVADVQQFDASMNESGTWVAQWQYTKLVDTSVALLSDDEEGFGRSTSESSTPPKQHGALILAKDEHDFVAVLKTPGGVILDQSDVVYGVIHCPEEREATATLSQRLAETMNTLEPLLRGSRVDTVCFVVSGGKRGARVYTYLSSLNWEEIKLHRNALPTTANKLELSRMQNYDLRPLESSDPRVHLYLGQAVRSNSTSVTTSVIDKRVFVRLYVLPGDLGLDPFSEVSEEDAAHVVHRIVDAIELAWADREIAATTYNHIFVAFLDLEFNTKTMSQMLENLEKAYASQLYQLGFREIELKFRALHIPSGQRLPFRVDMKNHTTYALSADVYIEMPTDEGGVEWTAHRSSSFERLSRVNTMLRRDPSADLGGSRDALTSRGLASIRVQSVVPYPLPSKRQLKRLQAQRQDTVYACDWPILFEVALRDMWRAFAQSYPEYKCDIPASLVSAVERTVWHGELVKGESECGMLVFDMSIYLPSDFNEESRVAPSRRVLAIANDITHHAGSVSVDEDLVFHHAALLAQRESLPLIYLASNSGARLSMCEQVKDCFRVAVTPSGGVDYLYLSSEDYEKYASTVNTQRLEVDGEVRFRIDEIVGDTTTSSGTVNLRGSALTATDMAAAYAKIPTISVVSGRSVGIGAYLVRLGRRVVQREGSPIILTGYTALNRLLGRSVYSSNDDLGGVNVMATNGVTHWTAKDDRVAVEHVLKWLQYIPREFPTGRCSTAARFFSTERDPANRDVTFTPPATDEYDSTFLLTGSPATTGLLDRNSWMPSSTKWAKSVITGRGSLGGIPIGVIVAETRATTKAVPADPSDPKSSAAFCTQAGQVWYPDSARKTAEAIEDFNNEGLPCLVLANWRGFSGGRRDMVDEVLKFGSTIVDNFRLFRGPVLIYVPPGGPNFHH